MAECNALLGVPKDCGDNNLGSIKRALVGSYNDVTSVTQEVVVNPEDAGVVGEITMVSGKKFEDFPLLKDTSSMTQEWTGDLVADVHSYMQSIELGFRRIDLRKRNAIMLMANGRRDLMAIVQDNNDKWWLLGSDQGLRLSANSATTGTTRASGQQTPVTLTSENERYMWLSITEAKAIALLTAAA